MEHASSHHKHLIFRISDINIYYPDPKKHIVSACMSESYELFQIPGGASRSSSCASSNSGKKTNVETEATHHKMDDNGTLTHPAEGKAWSPDMDKT